MRTTLYERLKPVFKLGLTKGKKDLRFTNAINNIEKDLNDKVFYSDLSVSQIDRVWLFASIGYQSYSKRNTTDWRFGEDMFELINGCA